MKKIVSLLLLCTLLAIPLVAQKANLDDKIDSTLRQKRYADQEIIVKFKDKSRLSPLGIQGIRSMERLSPSGIYRITISTDMRQAFKILAQNEGIEYAEPNYLVKALVQPNDAEFGKLWGMSKIQALKAWDIRTDGASVLVAVIDTGIDYNHKDLVGNVWINEAEANGKPGVDDDGNGYVDDIHGCNAARNTGDPLDDHGHGTHCSGTIGAKGNNSIGVAGVCWTAKVMGCKFLDNSGGGTSADAVKAIEYAVANKAKVLSNSWGGAEFSQAIYDSIKAAKNAGVLFIAAAGNDPFPGSVLFPAGYSEDTTNDGQTYPGLDNILVVAASTQDDSRAFFSQYSIACNDHGNMIVAPGYQIYSTFLGGIYRDSSGTSMATPHVAGAAALVWAHYPNLKYLDVKKKLVATSDTITWNLDEGATKVKRLNLYNLLK